MLVLLDSKLLLFSLALPQSWIKSPTDASGNCTIKIKNVREGIIRHAVTYISLMM